MPEKDDWTAQDKKFTQSVENMFWAFPGNPRKHGVMKAYDPLQGKKDVSTDPGAVTIEMIEAHIRHEGHVGRIGYMPGRAETTNVGVIDIDRIKYPDAEEFNSAVLDVRNVLSLIGIKFYTEVSTNGGMHIWIFTQDVGYGTMRDFLKDVLKQADQRTLEYYPMGNGGVDGRWVFVPYSGSYNDTEGKGMTWLEDEDGAHIPVWRLKERIQRLDAATVEKGAAAQRRDTQDRAEDPKRKRMGDLNPLALGQLKEMMLNSPKSFNRHNAIIVFLNLSRRASSMQAMKDFLKTNEVYERWISDGSRTFDSWGYEVDRWAEPMYHGDDYGSEYGIPELKALGWNVGNLFKMAETPGEDSLGKLKPTEVAQIYAEKLRSDGVELVYIRELDQHYQYDSGVYKQRTEWWVEKDIEDWHASMGGDISETRLTEVLTKLNRRYLTPPENFIESKDYVVWDNGVYNWRTGEFVEHSPQIIQFSRGSGVFNEALRGNTEGLFTQMLETSLPDKYNGILSRAALQEFFGYCLTPETGMQKMLNMHGASGSGKGAISRVISAVLGANAENTASMVVPGMQFEALGNDHMLEPLINKRAVFIGEIKARGSKAEAAVVVLKQIVGEDALMVNPKNRRPYSKQLTAKLVISSNVHIHLGEDSANDSVTRRMLMVRFHSSIPAEKRDPLIVEKILDDPLERSKVVMWLIEGLDRLRDNGWKLTDNLTSNLDELKDEANSCIEFVRENLEYHTNIKQRIPASELLAAFNAWADFSGVSRLNRVSFKAKMLQALSVLGMDDEAMGEDNGAGWISMNFGKVFHHLKFRSDRSLNTSVDTTDL